MAPEMAVKVLVQRLLPVLSLLSFQCHMQPLYFTKNPKLSWAVVPTSARAAGRREGVNVQISVFPEKS